MIDVRRNVNTGISGTRRLRDDTQRYDEIG